jgi:hypothetical protein
MSFRRQRSTAFIRKLFFYSDIDVHFREIGAGICSARDTLSDDVLPRAVPGFRAVLAQILFQDTQQGVPKRLVLELDFRPLL